MNLLNGTKMNGKVFFDDDDVDNHERSESLGEFFEQYEDNSNSVTEEEGNT